MKEILKKDGDSEDIAGHESIHRNSITKLTIYLCDGYSFVITSDSKITVNSVEPD